MYTLHLHESFRHSFSPKCKKAYEGLSFVKLQLGWIRMDGFFAGTKAHFGGFIKPLSDLMDDRDAMYSLYYSEASERMKTKLTKKGLALDYGLVTAPPTNQEDYNATHLRVTGLDKLWLGLINLSDSIEKQDLSVSEPAELQKCVKWSCN